MMWGTLFSFRYVEWWRALVFFKVTSNAKCSALPSSFCVDTESSIIGKAEVLNKLLPGLHVDLKSMEIKQVAIRTLSLSSRSSMANLIIKLKLIVKSSTKTQYFFNQILIGKGFKSSVYCLTSYSMRIIYRNFGRQPNCFHMSHSFSAHCVKSFNQINACFIAPSVLISQGAASEQLQYLWCSCKLWRDTGALKGNSSRILGINLFS